MAGINGNVGSYEFPKIEKVYTNIHEPVILTMEIKEDQGTLQRGLIVARDTNGKVVPYNPGASDSTATPIGVLVEDVDTEKEITANVLVHGVVFRERLIVANADLTTDDLNKLAQITIWNIG
jgi:hypothetical protein